MAIRPYALYDDQRNYITAKREQPNLQVDFGSITSMFG